MNAVSVESPEPGGLAIEAVSVVYGTHQALDEVSLCVAPGEVVALLGPSGCGKSTLLRAVAGLEPLGRGRVLWGGEDLAGLPVHRRGFGLMFQEGQLFPHRDVLGNVEYGLAHMARPERHRRASDLLDLVGLTGYAHRPVATLSGGEQQRVALARALAPHPRLLLLDEPLSALDRGLRERLVHELRDILSRTHTTAIFVTHDHDEAFAVAGRVAVMDQGRLVQIAPPAEVWRFPANEAVARFLGCTHFIDAEVVDLAGPAPASRSAGLFIQVRSALGHVTLGPLDGKPDRLPAVGDFVRLALRPGALRLSDASPASLAVRDRRFTRAGYVAEAELPGLGRMDVTLTRTAIDGEPAVAPPAAGGTGPSLDPAQVACLLPAPAGPGQASLAG